MNNLVYGWILSQSAKQRTAIILKNNEESGTNYGKEQRKKECCSGWLIQWLRIFTSISSDWFYITSLVQIITGTAKIAIGYQKKSVAVSSVWL